ASLFGFSKKVPNGFKKEPIEKASKALKTLLIITGLLVICFSPVFSSYRSEEAKNLVQLENDLIQLESKGLGDKILQSEVSQQETKKQIQTQIYKLREPLEKKRLYWLSAGLFVIIGGLIFANIKSKKNTLGWGAMQYPQLVLGMIAIFVYVGVEVAVGSNLGELLKQKDFGGYDSSQIAPFISMYWGSLMIGRWSGSINAFDLSVKTKQILRFLVPLIAFGIILGVTSVVGYNVKTLYWYVLCVLIQIVAFYVAGDKPIRTLFIFGILGVLAFIVGLTSSGMTAIYAFLSVGLFCSIMWPCIFSLSLAGLGKYQAQGSGFLVMMILGGAIIPPIQGKLSDIIGIQSSFFIGMFCMAYIVFFAYRVKKLININ
ncbi:MAG: MFS transporter, partial [Crocinitomicaceae bacterium]